MQGKNKIAPHETFEVHELLMFKSVCANKAAMMSSMVKDPQLRGLLDSDLNQSKQQIQELRNFLSNSEYSNNTGSNWNAVTGSSINA